MRFLIRIVHLFFAVLPIYAIGFDLSHGSHNIANYFSHFTILSNVVTSCVFFYLAVLGTDKKGPTIDSVRGASLGYLVVSSAVYFLLLQNIYASPPIAWVNAVLHKIMPAVAVFGWLIFPPRTSLKLSESFKWLAFPIFYLAYTLIRGGILDYYPYPFLDPGTSGGLSVFIYCVVIAISGLILSAVIIVLGNKLRDFRK